MTKVTLSIEVAESVDVAALGTWLEAWIRDQWDGHGEPCTMGLGPGIRGLVHCDLHLKSVEAKPPASGRMPGHGLDGDQVPRDSNGRQILA